MENKNYFTPLKLSDEQLSTQKTFQSPGIFTGFIYSKRNYNKNLFNTIKLVQNLYI